jgi:hypothetical protein
VAPARQPAVPAQHGVRRNDQVRSTKLRPGEAAQERGEQRAVRPGEPGLADLPLQYGRLVARRRYLGILVAVAHRQQPHRGEHARQGRTGQSQQHRTILTPAGAARQSPSEAPTITVDRQGLTTVPTPGPNSTDEASGTYRVALADG